MYGYKTVGLVIHSAKGSEWEDHKYIKKIDGDYYYPDSYKGGRHLDSKNKKKSEDSEDGRIATNADLDESLVDELAKQVIRGTFGNGQIRKDLLGENYQKIQDRVNQLMKANVGNVKLSEVEESKSKEVGDKAVENVLKKSGSSNMSRVYKVYEDRKKRR